MAGDSRAIEQRRLALLCKKESVTLEVEMIEEIEGELEATNSP